MKRIEIVLLLVFTILCLSGCAGGSVSSSDSSGNHYDTDISGDISYEDNAKPGQELVGEGTIQNSESADSGSVQQTAERKINREMLVYTCSIRMDVLEFDEAVDSFRAILEEYEGFVEHENYTDNKGSVNYYQTGDDVWHDYTATVRVPSSKYEAFTESISEIGDLRSKNAEVENVSQEYTDAQTTLAIYEAKKERYLNLLSTITDESYALEVENQLTELEIQIAQLKTRINDIETDVAYSYVNVAIHEVKEYDKKPEKTDTFLQRMGNAMNKSWSNFLELSEKLLYVIIYLLPYMIIVVIVLFIVLLCLNRKYKIFGKKKKTNIPPQ